MSPASRARRLVAAGWALTLVLLLIAGAFLLRRLVAEPGAGFPVLGGTSEQTFTEREVRLYFSAPGAEGLQAEVRTLPITSSLPGEIRAAVEALIHGPRRGLTPTLDARVRLLNVYVLDRLAVLDFSAELQTTHGGGSINELLTIYSLVNTITRNFDTVERVKILVEGEEVDTLRGHVDTRAPFRADPEWILPELPS